MSKVGLISLIALLTLTIITTVQGDELFGFSKDRKILDRPHNKTLEIVVSNAEVFGKEKDVEKVVKPLVGEQVPNEEANFLVDFHATEIKIRGEERLRSVAPANSSGFQEETDLKPLGFLTYVLNKNETTEVFLVRVLIDSKYIFHLQISVERDTLGGLFGHGVIQKHSREDKVYLKHPRISTLMKVLGPKTEDDHINIPEFN